MMKKAWILSLTIFSSAMASCDDDCGLHCLGPEDVIANSPMYPITCNGDWRIFVSAFYWHGQQENLTFAVLNEVRVPVVNPTSGEIDELNNLIDDDILGPQTNWEFGYKLGIGYSDSCDGWDFNFLWTHFQPSSHTQFSSEPSDTSTLISLWSAFAPVQGEVNFSRDIEALYHATLNLCDLDLGRAYWISRKMSLRPFVGLRYVKLDQSLEIEQRGGSWSPRMNPPQNPFSNEVNLQNDFSGLGPRIGLEALFHIGCGFRLYSLAAPSIVSGRFKASHDEQNRLSNSPYTKFKILENKSSIKASRAILDIDLGLEYSAMYCQCKYGITTRLGFEHHIFFNQNQLWRVVRISDTAAIGLPNLSGENVYDQRHGNFTTQGWTLSFQFSF